MCNFDTKTTPRTVTTMDDFFTVVIIVKELFQLPSGSKMNLIPHWLIYNTVSVVIFQSIKLFYFRIRSPNQVPSDWSYSGTTPD